jgi:hypothetical protein
MMFDETAQWKAGKPHCKTMIFFNDLASERQKPHVFSHMQKIESKDKCVHKNKHVTSTHRTCLQQWKDTMECGGGGKVKEHDRETTRSKYFISAQVEDIMISTESCQTMVHGREGLTQSNRGG